MLRSGVRVGIGLLVFIGLGTGYGVERSGEYYGKFVIRIVS